MLRKLASHLAEATHHKSEQGDERKLGLANDMPRNHGGYAQPQQPLAHYDKKKKKKRHDPEVGKLTRNYWDLSSDDEDDDEYSERGDQTKNEDGGPAQPAPVRLQKEDRFRIGERCRALYHANDSFYPAEVVEVIPLDFSGFKFSYTVQFLKNGTMQHETRQVDLQRAFFARSKSPLLASGAACRAVDHATDEFANAVVVRLGSRGLYTVRFTQSGEEQPNTKASEIQPNELLPDFANGDDEAEDDDPEAGGQEKKSRGLGMARRLRPGKSKPSGVATIWTCARRGETEAVMRFLYQDQVDIDEPEPVGSEPEGKRTALYFAAKHGHFSLVKRLLQAGAEDLDGFALLDATPEIRQFLSDYGFGKAKRDAKVVVRAGPNRDSGESTLEAVDVLVPEDSHGSVTSSSLSASDAHRSSGQSNGSNASFLRRSLLRMKRASQGRCRGKHNDLDDI